MDTQAMQQQQHVLFVCEAGQLLKKNNLSVFDSRCFNACVCSETLSETTEKISLVLMSEACHDAI